MSKRSVIVCLVAAALAAVTSLLIARNNFQAFLVGVMYGLLAFYAWRALR